MTSVSVTIYFMINAETVDLLTSHTRNKDPYKKTKQKRLVWATNCPHQHCNWLWSININLMHCSHNGSLSLRSSNISYWSAESTHLHDHKSIVMWMPFSLTKCAHVDSKINILCVTLVIYQESYRSRPGPYQYDYSELRHDNRFKSQQSNCRSHGQI
jgi:hypothetical protein